MSIILFLFGVLAVKLFNGFLKYNFIKVSALVSAILLPTYAFAAPAIVTSNVNVRSGPGVNYMRLATLPAGIRVDAGPCRGTWCQIRVGRNIGWVASRLLNFRGFTRGPVYPRSSTTVIIGGGLAEQWNEVPNPYWVPRWHYHRRTNWWPGYNPRPRTPSGPGWAPGYDPYREPNVAPPLPTPAPRIGEGVRPTTSSDWQPRGRYASGLIGNTRPYNSGR